MRTVAVVVVYFLVISRLTILSFEFFGPVPDVDWCLDKPMI